MATIKRAGNAGSELINYLINSKLTLASIKREIGIRLAASSIAFMGFSAYFLHHSKHAEEKAIKLALFAQELGVNVNFLTIESHNRIYNEPVSALEAVIGVKQEIILTLTNQLSTVDNVIIGNFIGDMLKHMVMELSEMRRLLVRAERVRDDPTGLQILNDDLLLINLYREHHHKYHDHDHHHHHHHHDKSKC
jgi:ferritin